LLALSFPQYGHPALGWVALAPLLVAIGQPARPARRPFLLGYLTGLVYFSGTLYWLTDVMTTFGGLPTSIATGVALLLVLYLAIYPAVVASIVARGVRTFGLPALWAAPLVWAGAEYLRGHLLTGFPWVPLGNSQIDVAPIAQAASLVGVYGLSAIVALGSVAAAWLVVAPRGRAAIGPAAAAVLVLGTAAQWGHVRVADGGLLRAGTPVRVALIQGNVAQGQKWDAQFANTIFTRYLSMSRRGVADGATLVVWPESATPFFFEEHPASEAIRRIASETGARLFIGSDQVDRGDRARLYNSAFLIQPTGSTGGVYRKMHLVPFGEYVPLESILSFAGPLVEQVGGFWPGDTLTVFTVREGRFSTGICYEAVFPELSRAAVRQGSQLLTSITNDAWFGRSSAPWQHLAMARMRSVETGRYMARAANTGVSALVDPYGRVIQQTGLFEDAVSVGEVRFLDGTTLYVMIGDVVPWAGIAVAVGLWLMGLRARRSGAAATPSSGDARAPDRS
jgi:apolipoprotein N-acyltransferase